MDRYLEIWNDIKSNLINDMSEDNFNDYFSEINDIYKVQNNIVYLIAPSDFVKNRVESVYLNRLNDMLNEYLTEKHIFRIVTLAKIKLDEAQKPVEELVSPKTNVSNSLNNTYNFDTFVVGPSNRLAYTSATKVADQPGVVANPFYIFGNVGLGKTHLMHCIGNYILENNINYNVLYVKTEQFVEDYVKNVNQNSYSVFAKKFEGVDVLLIDDIQFLAKKEKSQLEFFKLFEKFFAQQKQIVITSDRKASDLTEIMGRLVSRFEMGLTVDVNKPDLSLRIDILKKKLNTEIPNPEIVPMEVLECIASLFENNIRELEGALKRVLFWCSCLDLEYNVENTLQALQPLLKSSKELSDSFSSENNIQKIFDIASSYFKISIDDLLSTKRKKEIVYARQICWYIMKTKYNLTYKKIGKVFGDKDHTTIMHGCSVIEEQLLYEENTKNNVENIMRKMGKDPNQIS